MVKKRRKSKFTENRTARCDCGALVVHCKQCNAQLLPDYECLTSSNNRSDSDLQFALPKARSNSGAKMIKHSAIEIWSRTPSEIKIKRVWHFFRRSIRNTYNSDNRNILCVLVDWCT